MTLPPTRQLKLRAGSTDLITYAGTSPWDNDTAVLIEDGSTATIDIATGTMGDTLQVMFPAVSEVVYPAWGVFGIEVRVRAACTGNTNPDLAPPALGIRIIPGEGNVYSSEQRVAPLQYLAEPTSWFTFGGPGDLWSIPDVHQVAKDAATIGLIVEVDPRPWTQRPALIEVDVVELILHLQSVPFPVDPDAPPVADQPIARIQHQGFDAYGQEPVLLDPRELAVNYLEAQLWLGTPDGEPLPLIVMRGGYTDARRYHPGQMVYVGAAIYRCEVEKAAGDPFVTANWTLLS